MNVLILSCNTGQGHNAAGRAVKEELEQRGIACEMRDMLAMKQERSSRTASRIYVSVTTKAPKVFGCIYHVGAFISNAKIHSPVYWANALCAKNLKEYIEEKGFDCVVAPHLFPAETMTYLRSRYGIRIPCFAVATDYASIPFWEETRMDIYFIPHPDLTEEFSGKGIPAERLVASGIPVSRQFQGERRTEEARERLGCADADYVFTLMSGSMGFGHLADTVRELLKKGTSRTRIYVLGGNNETLKNRLRGDFAGDGRVEIVDYTDHAAGYMDACDVLITKPGGLTTTEAAVREVPLVHSAPIPGCETANVQFFSERGMSVEAKDEKQAAALAWQLAECSELRANMMEAQRREIPKNGAARICDYIQQALDS